jgi:hypothetical protein
MEYVKLDAFEEDPVAKLLALIVCIVVADEIVDNGLDLPFKYFTIKYTITIKTTIIKIPLIFILYIIKKDYIFLSM